jgi:hypothetical protein
MAAKALVSRPASVVAVSYDLFATHRNCIEQSDKVNIIAGALCYPIQVLSSCPRHS